MTERAPSARHGRVEHDALACARSLLDDSGELVAEDERFAQHRVSDPALEEPVPVGATQADTPDAREHLPRLRLGVRLLVQPQLADAM